MPQKMVCDELMIQREVRIEGWKSIWIKLNFFLRQAWVRIGRIFPVEMSHSKVFPNNPKGYVLHLKACDVRPSFDFGIMCLGNFWVVDIW